MLTHLSRLPGSEWLIRRLHLSKARILTYHRFHEEALANFERQCRHLRRYYRPVSLDAYVSALRESKPLPPGSFVFTIDDGYLDVYENAAPILRRYEIPATVAVVSGFLDLQLWLWWDMLAYAFEKTSLSGRVAVGLPGCETTFYSLDGEEQRRQSAAKISLKLLRTDNDCVMQHVAAVARQLEVDIPAKPVPGYAPMSWEQARELTRHGITIASHTVNHKIVGTLRSYDSKRFEIFESKRRIEEMLQQPVRHFCFPNGGIGDYSHVDVQLIREAGYDSALTTFIGMQHSRIDVYQLPRINMGAEFPFNAFRMKLAGLFHHAGAVNLPNREQM
jgi:peptidoglycan/xylan/chitin deacetylase (PgdA/CDA1 family)